MTRASSSSSRLVQPFLILILLVKGFSVPRFISYTGTTPAFAQPLLVHDIIITYLLLLGFVLEEEC